MISNVKLLADISNQKTIDNQDKKFQIWPIMNSCQSLLVLNQNLLNKNKNSKNSKDDEGDNSFNSKFKSFLSRNCIKEHKIPLPKMPNMKFARRWINNTMIRSHKLHECIKKIQTNVDLKDLIVCNNMITKSMDSNVTIDGNTKAVSTEEFKSASPCRIQFNLIKSSDEIFRKASVYKEKDQAIQSMKAKTKQRLKNMRKFISKGLASVLSKTPNPLARAESYLQENIIQGFVITQLNMSDNIPSHPNESWKSCDKRHKCQSNTMHK